MRTTDINGINVPELEDAPPDIEVAMAGMDQIDELLIARFTSLAERNAAISSPAYGQMCTVYDTREFYMWNGSAWVSAKARFTSCDSDLAIPTTTPVDITGMSFNVEADSTYVLDGWIRHMSTVNTNDLTLNWTVPTGAVGIWGWNSMALGATLSINNSMNSVAAAITSSIDGGVVTTSTMTSFWARFATVSTAGTIQLQGSEQTSISSNSVTVQSRTWMRMWKVG